MLVHRESDLEFMLVDKCEALNVLSLVWFKFQMIIKENQSHKAEIQEQHLLSGSFSQR